MIRVDLTMLPGGNPAKQRSLGVLLIINTGQGTATRGNYRWVMKNKAGAVFHSGTVLNFPRKQKLAYRLVQEILNQVYP